VVAVGFTVTATPLVAERLPGVMTPVPFEKTPVRDAGDPLVMVLGLALKLEMEGAGVTVIVSFAVAGVALPLLTVRV